MVVVVVVVVEVVMVKGGDGGGDNDGEVVSRMLAYKTVCFGDINIVVSYC